MEGQQLYQPLEFRDKIYGDLKVTVSDSVILMCAILIASIGLNMNSTAVIIGAMLISPLMTPILGMGFALSILDFPMFKKALKLLAVEVGVSLLVATLYFALSPVTYASSEIIARTSPTIWDVIIAFAGGTAGIIGARKKSSNNIVPGVAIATALMPPVCTIGYAVATLNWEYFFGASYLFVINCAFIMIATFIGIRLMQIPQAIAAKTELSRKFSGVLWGVAILIVIPSIFSAGTLVQESIRKSAVNQVVEDKFSDHVVLNQNYDSNKKHLTLMISGEKMSAEEVDEISAELPDYGLKDVTLEVEQVPDLNELSGVQAAEYLDQYIKSKLAEINDIEQKESETTDSGVSVP
ncbi:MAG: DUF389 domain-containing protein [Enterococcus sp.]